MRDHLSKKKQSCTGILLPYTYKGYSCERESVPFAISLAPYDMLGSAYICEQIRCNYVSQVNCHPAYTQMINCYI